MTHRVASVRVSSACIGCGQSEGNCPEVFAMRDGKATVRPEADLSRHSEEILHAARECPVEAIEVTTIDVRAEARRAAPSGFERLAQLSLANWVWIFVALSTLGFAIGAFRFYTFDTNVLVARAKERVETWPGIHLHALAGTLWAIAGLLQFLPQLRRTPALHRWIGRTYLGLGAIAIAAFTQMTWVLGDRALFGQSTAGLKSGILAVICAGLSYWYIRRRDFQAHRAWMIRSYSLVFHVPFFRIFYLLPRHVLDKTYFKWLSGISLLLCILGAELLIHRRLGWKPQSLPAPARALAIALLAALCLGAGIQCAWEEFVD
jgi:ferredoxin